MSNLKLVHAIMKLAEKINENDPPTELESEVIKELLKIERYGSSKGKKVIYSVPYGVDQTGLSARDDEPNSRGSVRLVVQELWTGAVFALYQFAEEDNLRAWTKKFDTDPYKGSPKNIAKSIHNEIAKSTQNIMRNSIEDRGFTQR